MNLLDKKKSWGAMVFGLLLLISCEERGEFGLGSDDVAPVVFSSTDIPVTSSVVFLDSIRTSSTGILLAGKIDDPDFGTIEASGFTRLDLNKPLLGTLPTAAELDSVELTVRFTYQYDNTPENQDFTLNVFRLTRGIIDTLQITRSRTVVGTQLLASADLTVSNLDSSYVIDMDPAWSNEIFELLRADADEIQNQDAFESFFRGLAFVSDDQATNILGVQISEATNITIYYREPSSTGDVDRNASHTMTIHTVPNFYGLDIDRSASNTSVLTEHGIEYEPANGKRYVQSGGGIVTKLDLSGFRDFLTDAPRVINLAEMTIGPIDETPEGVLPPQILFLYLTDDRNTLIRDRDAQNPTSEVFRSIQRDGANPLSFRNPVQFIFDSDTRTYSASLTSFIQGFFTDGFQWDEVFLYPAEMNIAVSGISFDPEDVNFKIIFSELQ